MSPHSGKSPVYLWIGLLFLATVSACYGQKASQSAPVTVVLPSAQPAGNAINDRIWITYYAAAGTADSPRPAVVLVHPLGQEPGSFKLLLHVASFLSQHGIGSAVMMLPYHLQRLPPGDNPIQHFVALRTDLVVQAMSQSASDVSTVVSWLERQPGVDPHRIGIVGVSLGAIIAHLAMGQDSRLSAGVAILGGGDLADLYHRSILFRWYHSHLLPLTPRDREELRTIDPITYADRNQPRRVLMIEASRDLLIPPHDSIALWKALGRPPIQWLDTDHYAPAWGASSIMKTSLAYLESVWADPETPSKGLPHVWAPTIKVGFLFGLDSVVTLAAQWQMFSLIGRPDHMSLLHIDLGWSGKGPFLGLAVTVNPFIDVGIGHRFLAETFKPYLSLHFVF